ncbi:glucose-1-phosphate adenylyltransferase [Natranaerovirga pectinivora]|uniref:Glucose-1-phosphate adenylyltransferase n=1 Tax=Natranaerovirga pectinivora TaxID=682400 RepID=A0A4R3MMV9_9FIRM|nr:glucose-1-phosphate adenylyltransferase subunit GlgD [Natranaerovirga pectinivora]TCT15364.1 glucose-1-phosphate adenylyltransferase [Natranaerovirga pectinivora]
MDVMGIIDLNEEIGDLKELSEGRAMAAIPVGSKYRVIDFVLSNMVNSGIKNIGLLKNTLCRSLMDHIYSKKEWGLDKKDERLHFLNGIYEGNSRKKDKGVLEALQINLDYLIKSKEKYVVISGSKVICNINYSELKDFHIKNNADITVVYKEMGNEDCKLNKFNVLILDEGKNINKVQIKSKHNQSNKVLMGMYFLEKTLLIDIINKCNSKHKDFLVNGVINNIGKLKVLGFEFNGYMKKISCIDSYYNFNFDLLKEDTIKELLYDNGSIITKSKSDAPTKYKEGAEVSNSLIANGCIIEGKVENCIIFRGVNVKKGAYIKNSIIMQNTIINEEAVVENIILDKEVKIQKGTTLIGNLEAKSIVPKKTVV